MSELITAQPRTDKRLQLLATVSAIALLTIAATQAKAEDADRPTVWIEGGWHFDSVAGSNSVVVPPLDGLTTNGFSSTPTASNFYGQGAGGFPSFTEMEKTLAKSQGAEGSISFQPKGSDWIFNLSGRYGRAHSKRRLDQRHEIDGMPGTEIRFTGTKLVTPHNTNYVIQASDNKEAHVIVDFQVGKDIGIGLFGGQMDSVLSAGVRYAQINTSSKGHSYAAPAVRFYGHGGYSFGKYSYVFQPDTQKSATLQQRSSSFHGVGPSLSWSNTTGLVGDVADGQLALDWGANAALLFGRQKSKVNYSTAAHSYHYTGPFSRTITTQHKTVNRTQSRRVTVPNLGGFAALSYRFTNAKISAGYRADFFFGAMDGGLDTHKSITTGFQGPFAKISVGLGG
ncbi:MAG TPA: hypothetical protein VL026_13430, partial [Rhizomicrobium sp.]|nr:hypothetical protein [Rhizomicrobium sp.]